jgi:hypothetical protein
MRHGAPNALDLGGRRTDLGEEVSEICPRTYFLFLSFAYCRPSFQRVNARVGTCFSRGYANRAFTVGLANQFRQHTWCVNDPLSPTGC